MKALKWLDSHLEEVILAVLLIGIAFLIILQVICRYIFNNSLSWSDELARYFLVWSCFLSVSYCVKKRISIKIDQVRNLFKGRLLYAFHLLTDLIILAFAVIMIPYALTYLDQAASSGATSTALHLPMTFIQSAPLAGFILLLVREVENIVLDIRSLIKNLPLEGKENEEIDAIIEANEEEGSAV